MTQNYCTLFDKNYLYQAVALYQSLLRHSRDFRLYALCMDATALELMQKLSCDSLVAIDVEDLLTPEIAAVRQRTTHGQFCWVCQPLICRFVLDRFHVSMVTYLESDSMFYSDPSVLFDEIGSGSVSLVPHNYSEHLDNTADAGQYCVQFNAFRSDDRAAAVLSEWTNACFRYDKSRRELFPGQTVLDAWPTKFPGVVVIRHIGAGVAPWNVRSYQLGERAGVPTVNGLPTVFYHYHQYGRFRSGAHELGSYPLSRQTVDLFYRPYVAALEEARATVCRIDPRFNWRRVYEDHRGLLGLLASPGSEALAEYLNVLKRKVRGRYNVYPDSYFSGVA